MERQATNKTHGLGQLMKVPTRNLVAKNRFDAGGAAGESSWPLRSEKLEQHLNTPPDATERTSALAAIAHTATYPSQA